MTTRPPFKRVTKDEIRQLFNDGEYWSQAKSGRLIEKLFWQGHPSPQRSGEPPCTRSQIVSYFDSTGREIARVHQYLRKDGTLGGSGRPDPKKLFHNGVLYGAL